ncbi:PIN domain-containing protein [Treponema sp. OttesenSCG-928-L16]|nr:PIN domain-containing protein [Treponema sp. OttesenSCG-928-L16]
MNVLIDTTIWSKYFRRKKISEKDRIIVNEVDKIFDDLREILIGPIRQELLSGISNEATFAELKEKLAGFNDFIIETIDYELAAEYHNICRRNGIQGSSTDYLICALAVKNDWEIFTEDTDFQYYKRYLPIKLYKMN